MKSIDLLPPTPPENAASKQAVWDWWAALDNPDPAVAEAATRALLHAGLVFHGHDPVNQLQGLDAFLEGFWRPLRTAFPDLRRQAHLFMGGASNGRRDGDARRDGRHWVSGTGLMNGTFAADYLGIPATGQRVSLRWGEFCRIEEGRVAEIYFQIDLIDFLQQIGISVLPTARGVDGIWPAPRAGDGIMLQAQDEAQSRYSLDHIWRFIFQGLNSFDQSDLRSMGMADWFHPRVHWFGPGGIGACLDFAAFETLHQQPWLVAFPDRSVQDLDALIAEGPFSGAPGWAGVIATHSGPYLDCPPTGRRIAVNGMDWWKREGEVYTENWVFVDMVYLFRQFGVDLLARAREQARRHTENAT
jgi:predicted ester cyclase